MNNKPQSYARYYIIRGNQALWKGDPAESGAQFRQVVMTSNAWNSTQGAFQVYCLEGASKGVADGKFSVSPETFPVIFDGDFQGAEAAGKKFDELVREAQRQGFKNVSVMDEMEFQAKLRKSSV